MKIFYFFKELNTPMYQWQRIHFIDELERNGHQFVTFNPLDYASMDEANEKVLHVIRKEKGLGLFLACDDSDVIYKETVDAIKGLGIPTCLICWDNLELPYKQKEIAPFFDVVWLTSVETKYLFEKWGCRNIVFATYAANPYRFVPVWNNFFPVVGFIGSPYGSRVNKLNDLLWAKVNCRVYSDALFRKGYNTSVGGVHKIDICDIGVKAFRYLRFPIGRKVLYSTIKNKFMSKAHLDVDSPYLSAHHSVSDNEMVELYGDFALSLNITELRDTYICKNPIHKVHLRTFEIPMSGGLEFASYTDEIASYFEEDKEIVLYKNRDEMVDKARFYLNPTNAGLVRQMKMKAHKRAMQEHTWTNRFNSVFSVLK